MPSKWIGCNHRGQVGKTWSPREEAHRYDPQDKSCNTGRPEYDMQSHGEFSMEPTNKELPFSVQRVRLPPMSTGPR